MGNKKVKIVDVQGRPHTLTQSDGKTFRLLSRQSKVLNENLISAEFLAEQKRNNILIIPIKDEVTKNLKGGNK